ncbi:MAG: TolC family protein [Leptospirales bacterium]|nr:TolC family protein [Leptospirales bacterium]
MNRVILLLSLAFTQATRIHAQPVAESTFREIVARVQSQGQSRAAGLELQAQTIARERSERHIYPRVYLDARALQTNDATNAFMANLAQRSATIVDFLPDRLNRPGSTNLQKAALGVDLPLYEGGGKSAMAKVQKNIEEIRREDVALTLREEFVTVLGLYASLLTTQDLNPRLLALEAQADQLLARYQLGSAANPVGYSGLLGLRALKNRLQSLRQTFQAQHKTAHYTLRVLSGLPESWKYANVSLESLLREASPGSISASHKLRSLQAAGKTKESMIDVETARFLPRAGLFAETVGSAGKRRSASAYNVGFYLTMNLFAPEDFGARSQAKLESEAINGRIADLQRREEAEYRALQSHIEVTKRNLALLDESERLLDEQIRTARELFRTGSIQLGQFVEILSRRADQVEQRATLSAELTRAHGSLYLLSSDESPARNGENDVKTR